MSGDSLSLTAVSSPMSVSSPGPVALAPRATSVAYDAVAASPAGLVTHKEWVIPPRPKPGRKPATDIPPTKRKAQNRAAQRAFRERRAARVNELEDKLKEVETENATRVQDYQDQIQQLASNNAELAKENSRYKTKLECMQKELELLRQLKSQQQQQHNHQQQQQQQTPASSFLTQVASPTPSSGHETPCSSNYACADDLDKVLCAKNLPAPPVPLRRRSTRNRPTAPSRSSSPDPLGCGRCSKNGVCACITEAAASIYSSSNNPKRPTSPSSNIPKRTRTTSYVDLTPPDELETDFTAAYMAKPPPAPVFSDSTSSLARMSDPCGFCSDGTHCVCAEAAAAAAVSVGDMLMGNDMDSEEHHTARLPPLLSNHTPPPVDNNTMERLMALHPPMTRSSTGQGVRSSGCQPGGCKQCQNDPMSTLFCQSVATKVGRPEGCSGGGCCGGSNKALSATASSGARDGNEGEDKGIFISASAAYQALSRHRGFEEATADLGSLVRPLMVKQADGRCPLVEVSSVSDVLKQLDRRFGSDVN